MKIFEKITEFAQRFEMRFNVLDDDYLYRTLDFLDEEVLETRLAVNTSNNTEIIDGCLDVSFVALNLLYKKLRMMEYTHHQATELVEVLLMEVADNNLSKEQDDGSIIVKDGKIQKPEGWEPPKIEAILEAYRFNK